jgi:hypothetical protein
VLLSLRRLRNIPGDNVKLIRALSQTTTTFFLSRSSAVRKWWNGEVLVVDSWDILIILVQRDLWRKLEIV